MARCALSARRGDAPIFLGLGSIQAAEQVNLLAAANWISRGKSRSDSGRASPCDTNHARIMGVLDCSYRRPFFGRDHTK